jgi:hypothetical protein
VRARADLKRDFVDNSLFCRHRVGLSQQRTEHSVSQPYATLSLAARQWTLIDFQNDVCQWVSSTYNKTSWAKLGKGGAR